MPPASGSRLAAALVHVYTAIGAVLAFLMVVAIQAREITMALWLFLAAMIVDGTDGFLARHFRVKELWPGFDGALLDNIVDYLTYCFAPVTLLWLGGYLPTGPLGWVVACAPLLASCFQFARTDARTDDHLFLGFPSYWNVVAFYVLVLDLPVAAVTAALVVLAVLVFVPVKYVYPSRTPTWWYTNMAATAAWFVAYAFIVAQLPDPAPWLVGLSLAYVGFYIVESLILTFRKAQATRAAEPVIGTASA